jgi:hypothetical protein
MRTDITLLLRASRKLERCLPDIPVFGNREDRQFVGTVWQSKAASEGTIRTELDGNATESEHRIALSGAIHDKLSVEVQPKTLRLGSGFESARYTFDRENRWGR